jgi:hypothetical protein
VFRVSGFRLGKRKRSNARAQEADNQWFHKVVSDRNGYVSASTLTSLEGAGQDLFFLLSPERLPARESFLN